MYYMKSSDAYIKGEADHYTDDQKDKMLPKPLAKLACWEKGQTDQFFLHLIL